jgi:hypothetical protein
VAVIHDFLVRIAGNAVVKDILRNEDSAAAYRFGHSMVRPAYDLNDTVQDVPLFVHSNRPDALWYCVLKEAEVRHDGEQLGPVGGGIVAEVLIGLLSGDPQSYLTVQPTWKPTGVPAAKAVAYTPADFLKFGTSSDERSGRRRVRRALVEARQPVVGDRLPRRRIGDELARARAHAGVAVDRRHPYRDDVQAGTRGEEPRAAVAAEDLLEAVGRRPGRQVVLALEDPHRAGLDADRRGGRGPRTMLAAGAVTVDGAAERGGDLEAHGTAGAAAGEESGHQGTVG